jgi:hypothetical protein
MKDGILETYERCSVIEATSHNSKVTVTFKHSDGDVFNDSFDRVWLGTGSELNVNKESIFQSLLEKFPPPLVDNAVPLLHVGLRWGAKVPCHVLGAYSCLTVGPGAFNLGGSISCADRVIPVIEAQFAQNYKLSGKGQSNVSGEDPDDPKQIEYLCKTRRHIGNGQGLYSLLENLKV